MLQRQGNHYHSICSFQKIYIFYIIMEFEFDARKSDRNRGKHGIDFRAAQDLWSDPNALLIPARTEGESRWMLIGKIRGKLWSAIFTTRAHSIRIISVRRARHMERKWYESERI